MNKLEAKNYLNKIAEDKNKESTFYYCGICPIGDVSFPTEQVDVYNFLRSYKLYNISTCSSRFLYICLKYKPKQIQNIIDYAKKITRKETVFLDHGFGCPCDCLSKLSKYVLLSKEELLDIE